MGKANIENIVSLCKKGNKKAQKTLFELYAPKMLFVCRRYFSSSEDGEDAFIEGFMKVFESLYDYTYIGENSFNLWVRKIMINHCINILRKNKRLSFLNQQIKQDTEQIKQESVANYPQNQFTQEDMELCLKKLPENLKTVFNMLVIDEFSQKEVAQRLETSEGVVKVYAYRARQILQKELEKILDKKNKNEYRPTV